MSPKNISKVIAKKLARAVVAFVLTVILLMYTSAQDELKRYAELRVLDCLNDTRGCSLVIDRSGHFSNLAASDRPWEKKVAGAGLFGYPVYAEVQRGSNGVNLIVGRNLSLTNVR